MLFLFPVPWGISDLEHNFSMSIIVAHNGGGYTAILGVSVVTTTYNIRPSHNWEKAWRALKKTGKFNSEDSVKFEDDV